MDGFSLVAAVIISQLGCDDYRVRERAMAALCKMPIKPIIQLHLAEHCTNRERAIRARWLLHAFYSATAEARASVTMPSNYHRIPWISEIPTILEQGTAQAYLERARAKIGIHGPPDWKDYDLATSLLMVDLYRERYTTSEVVRVLDTMAETERDWITNFGQRYGN